VVFGNKLALFLGFSALAASLPGRGSATPPKPAAKALLTISVFNDAQIPAESLKRAEEHASRVFREAGLEIAWLNCRGGEAGSSCKEVDYPRHLHLRIRERSLNASGETVGMSFLASDGTGCYADVFYEPAVQLQMGGPNLIDALLGHAVAHEIGHLLLGTNSHAEVGIMRGRWSRAELLDAPRNPPHFSEREGRKMREKLLVFPR
jgi:hypothetical protein